MAPALKFTEKVDISSSPARLWKAFAEDGHNVLPKFAPGLSRVEVDGDGKVGTTRIFHFNGDFPSTKRSVRSRVEVYDESGYQYAYSVLPDEDDKFQSSFFSFKVDEASGDGSGAVITIDGEFVGDEGYEPTVEEQGVAARLVGTIKGVDAYLLANPEAYA